MEAIRATTVYGGQIMMRGHELGAVKEGFLADLLLVDGDPLQDLKLLQDKNRIPCVMKGGMFHRRAL
jgi:imidazolonepropionase-like amidohydrolase